MYSNWSIYLIIYRINTGWIRLSSGVKRLIGNWFTLRIRASCSWPVWGCVNASIWFINGMRWALLPAASLCLILPPSLPCICRSRRVFVLVWFARLRPNSYRAQWHFPRRLDSWRSQGAGCGWCQMSNEIQIELHFLNQLRRKMRAVQCREGRGK